MTHAYFIPDQDFVDAMKAAAGRGVDVRLLVPLKSNHIVADWISRGYFRCWRPGSASSGSATRWCAKTSTVDGTWSTIGTANVDRLSLQGNYEINVEVIDEALAKALEEIYAVDESNCLELTSGEWEAGTCTQVHGVRARSPASAALSRSALSRPGATAG